MTHPVVIATVGRDKEENPVVDTVIITARVDEHGSLSLTYHPPTSGETSPVLMAFAEYVREFRHPSDPFGPPSQDPDIKALRESATEAGIKTLSQYNHFIEKMVMGVGRVMKRVEALINLNITYDEPTDVLSIAGRKFSAEVFRTWAWPRNRFYRFQSHGEAILLSYFIPCPKCQEELEKTAEAREDA